MGINSANLISVSGIFDDQLAEIARHLARRPSVSNDPDAENGQPERSVLLKDSIEYKYIKPNPALLTLCLAIVSDLPDVLARLHEIPPNVTVGNTFFFNLRMPCDHKRVKQSAFCNQTEQELIRLIDGRSVTCDWALNPLYTNAKISTPRVDPYDLTDLIDAARRGTSRNQLIQNCATWKEFSLESILVGARNQFAFAHFWRALLSDWHAGGKHLGSEEFVAHAISTYRLANQRFPEPLPLRTIDELALRHVRWVIKEAAHKGEKTRGRDGHHGPTRHLGLDIRGNLNASPSTLDYLPDEERLRRQRQSGLNSAQANRAHTNMRLSPIVERLVKPGASVGHEMAKRIAKESGMHYKTVVDWLKDNGMQMDPREAKPQVRLEAAYHDMLNTGQVVRPGELATAAGVNRTTASKWLTKKHSERPND